MRFIEKSYAALEFSYEEVQAIFDGVIKCKYTGKVLEVTDVKPPTNGCYSTLYIKLENSSGKILLSQNGFSGNPCEGGDNLSIQYPVVPKIGEQIYGIVGKDTGFILRAGKKYYDAYPEIQLCEGQSYISTLPYMFSTPEKLGLGAGSIVALSILIFIAKKYLSRKYKHKK